MKLAAVLAKAGQSQLGTPAIQVVHCDDRGTRQILRNSNREARSDEAGAAGDEKVLWGQDSGSACIRSPG